MKFNTMLRNSVVCDVGSLFKLKIVERKNNILGLKLEFVISELSFSRQFTLNV